MKYESELINKSPRQESILGDYYPKLSFPQNHFLDIEKSRCLKL